MATERVLSNLNLISFKTEIGLQNHIDELQDGDLVFTPDNSLKGTLLDFKWADHLLNDMSWLRADTFSWQSGDVYVAAYNHLVADFEGAVAETTTIDGIEITYYLADDKHIICLPDQEDKLLELYNKTGVAWYYILDTENKQFKLPRSKHEHYGDRSVVGNGTPFTLTTNEVNGANMSQYNNLYQVSQISGVDSIPVNTLLKISSDPTKSGIISTPVEDTNQYKYLYFYVGNFERDAVEQTAGIAAEMFNSKADSDLKNIPTNYDYVVESQMPTEANGRTWYRKYKSGWIEQGGRKTSVSDVETTITLPVAMLNSGYDLLLTREFPAKNTTATNVTFNSVWAKSTTSFMCWDKWSDSVCITWYVSGMAA